jgi:hypothetical protein
MAVTKRPNSHLHASAGDASTGRYLITQLIWNGSSTAGDDLTVKDGSGVVILQLKSDGSSFEPVSYPFGNRMVDGFETDVLDAGSVEYIFG